MNNQNCVIEGENARVALALGEVESITCFPGQAVLLSGVNKSRMTGDLILAHKFLTNA